MDEQKNRTNLFGRIRDHFANYEINVQKNGVWWIFSRFDKSEILEEDRRLIWKQLLNFQDEVKFNYYDEYLNFVDHVMYIAYHKGSTAYNRDDLFAYKQGDPH
jgi:hypothetical protein